MQGVKKLEVKKIVERRNASSPLQYRKSSQSVSEGRPEIGSEASVDLRLYFVLLT